MSRSVSLAFAVAAVFASTLPAAAAITYNTVSRSLHAQSTSGGSLNDSITTSGIWSQSLTSADLASLPPGFDPATTSSAETGAGWAVQTSTLGFASIQAHLVSKAWDGRQGFGGGADSNLTTSFVVDAPTACTITGSWSTNYFPFEPGGDPASNFQFSGPGGLLALAGFSTSSPSTLSGPIAFSGTLAPGTYLLSASTHYNYTTNSTIGGARSMTMDFTISIPAPSTTAAALSLAAGWGLRRRRTPAISR